jgi:hypothetical protein
MGGEKMEKMHQSPMFRMRNQGDLSKEEHFKRRNGFSLGSKAQQTCIQAARTSLRSRKQHLSEIQAHQILEWGMSKEMEKAASFSRGNRSRRQREAQRT